MRYPVFILHLIPCSRYNEDGGYYTMSKFVSYVLSYLFDLDDEFSTVLNVVNIIVVFL